VSVANLRVPELPSRLPDVMRGSTITTSTACGYLILYIRLVASIFGAPLLLEPGFLGANSCIWQVDTFWRREIPPSQRSRLSGLPVPMVTWTAAASQALDSQQLLK
jgi:hypothetical protein